VSVGLVDACASGKLLAFAAHPRQRELLGLIESNRTVIAAAGRRFGKSRAAAAAAIWNLLLTPEADALVSKGEKRYAISVANSREQARIFLSHCSTLLASSPALRAEVVQENENEIVLSGCRVIAAMPCSAKSIRGYAASFVHFDEFAHFFDIEEGGPAVASKVWAALTPSVLQFRAYGRVVVTSTPAGSDGMFAELYAKARGGEIAGAVAFHAASAENPLVDPTFLEGQEVALGEDDYAREFGAEFIAGGASFLEASRVREVVADWKEVLPADGRGWVVAFDPSFAADPAAVAVVGRDPVDRSELIVGMVRRWVPQRRRKRLLRSREEETRVIESVVADVAAIAARFQARVLTDQHLPGVVTHEFAKHGIGVTVRSWSAESQREAFQNLRARIYTHRVRLPNEPQLVAELSRIRTNLRPGSSGIVIPKSGDSHCDIAVAVAAGVHEFDRYGVSGDAPMFGWDREFDRDRERLSPEYQF
jgi:phage terminase large subunit-like protein